MVCIYYSYIDDTIHDKLLDKYLKKFTIDYQNKVLRFRRWEDAQLSLLGRLLLDYRMNELNKKFSDDQLKYSEYHKPFFIDSDLKFNISHSGNIVVCAMSEEYEVGIDIELMNDIEIESFKSQMTICEWQKINAKKDKISAFYEYWTQKEAVVKAYGKGLSIPLKSFEIIEENTFIEDSFFVVREIPLNKDYKCNLAFKTINSVENHNFITDNEMVVKQICFEP
jgi:4'-phosphopantetheinyl transferase